MKLIEHLVEMNDEERREEAKRVVEYILSKRVVLSTIHKSLIKPAVGSAYNPEFLKDAQDWEFLPYRLEIMECFVQAGLELGVCSNEGGIAAGVFAGWEMILELRKIANRIQARSLQYCVYAPVSKDGRYMSASSRRFPNPEMIQDAMLDISVALKEEIFPGDMVFLYSFQEEKQAARQINVPVLHAGRVFTKEVLEELQRTFSKQEGEV